MENMVYCPKCGYILKKVSQDRIEKATGIIEYDAICVRCDIDVGVEDKSAFEQEGKILITFS